MRSPGASLLLASLVVVASACSRGATRSSAFDALLVERGLTFEAPPGYAAVSVTKSERWAHEHALRSGAFKLEVRYGAVPKEVADQLAAKCGADARCAAAPSAEALDDILEAAVGRIAKGGVKKVKAFPLDAVRDEFRAHWGGVVRFDVDPAFASYTIGLAVVIHRMGRGAAMFLALYDEHSDALEEEWMKAFHSLRFSEPFAAAASAELAAPLAGTRWRCENGFLHLRFEKSTWTVITVSAAMAAMGRNVPFETAYHEITYLPGSQLSARAFRIDNMERGDLTPKQPVDERFGYSRTGDNLVVDVDPSTKWQCTLVPQK